MLNYRGVMQTPLLHSRFHPRGLRLAARRLPLNDSSAMSRLAHGDAWPRQLREKVCRLGQYAAQLRLPRLLGTCCRCRTPFGLRALAVVAVRQRGASFILSLGANLAIRHVQGRCSSTACSTAQTRRAPPSTWGRAAAGTSQRRGSRASPTSLHQNTTPGAHGGGRRVQGDAVRGDSAGGRGETSRR